MDVTIFFIVLVFSALSFMLGFTVGVVKLAGSVAKRNKRRNED